MASAKVRASSRSGPDVSHHRRSAYGAYASPRAIEASMPPRNRWKPSVVRSASMMKGWSRGSTSVVMSFAEFASVRAIRMVGTSHRSEAIRAATSFWRKTPVETSTLPPRWPHFLALASWSSKCTALAPASISAFVSSKAFRGPPNPASPSATIGANQFTFDPPRGALLVLPHEGVVHPAHDIRNAVRRVQTLIGIHLARIVRIGGDLPAAQIDRGQAGVDLLDRLVARQRAEGGHRILRPDEGPQPLSADPSED